MSDPRVEDLPEPACQFGYTDQQLVEILKSRYGSFQNWMVGQTQAICENRLYDHDKGEYYVPDCGPHGIVTYRHDLEHFLLGLPVFD